jgi:hypothetical protein
MKAYLADLVRGATTPAHGRNLAREYLHARLLAVLQVHLACEPAATACLEVLPV